MLMEDSYLTFPKSDLDALITRSFNIDKVFDKDVKAWHMKSLVVTAQQKCQNKHMTVYN